MYISFAKNSKRVLPVMRRMLSPTLTRAGEGVPAVAADR